MTDCAAVQLGMTDCAAVQLEATDCAAVQVWKTWLSKQHSSYAGGKQ